MLATQINVEREEFRDNEIEFMSLVTGVGHDFIAVAGFGFEVSPATVMRDDHNNVISLADVKVGFFVEIRGEIANDGTMLATHIKIEDRLDDEIELTGEITGTRENTLTVDGKVFVVNESTVVLDNYNLPISFGALQVGMVVEVRGDVQMDGTLLAPRIKVEVPGIRRT
ncbi:MAG TPA: DUF5666 domain-containing protein [bacterium]